MLVDWSDGQARLNLNPNITPPLNKIKCHTLTTEIMQEQTSLLHNEDGTWRLLNLDEITENCHLWKQDTKEYLNRKDIMDANDMKVDMAFCTKRITGTSAAKLIHLIQHGLIYMPLLNVPNLRRVGNNARFCGICEKIYIKAPNDHKCKKYLQNTRNV